ncbi:MAG: class I SAM-dependent methyltransferase [Acidobacteria bacterium]|nr:class I SAM-dependent methyltransferase [Acidobacteriota bacterium]
MITDLIRALQPLRGRRLRRLLDIGCGFGGLTRLIGEYLEISELHGVDLDGRVLEEARQKGVVTHHIDVGEAKLPFPDGYFDLIVSFGMLDYLPYFDDILQEVFRTIRPDRYALLSLPNLASWHNRLCLLLGYQPRDIELSRKILAGVHPWYRPEYLNPTGHLRSATASAFQELMAYHGFLTVGLTGGRPAGRKKNPVLALADILLTRKVTLARRFFYLGSKRNGHER